MRRSLGASHGLEASWAKVIPLARIAVVVSGSSRR